MLSLEYIKNTEESYKGALQLFFLNKSNRRKKLKAGNNDNRLCRITILI